MSYSYDRRAAATPDLQMKAVRKGPSIRVTLHLGDQPFSEGWVTLSRYREGSLSKKCQENVESLSQKFSRPPPVWYVASSTLSPELRGKGWGKAMYERGLQEAAPAIIITGGCRTSGMTSKEAFRVWKSLSGKYPSAGSTANDFAIAVK